MRALIITLGYLLYIAIGCFSLFGILYFGHLVFIHHMMFDVLMFVIFVLLFANFVNYYHKLEKW